MVVFVVFMVSLTANEVDVDVKINCDFGVVHDHWAAEALLCIP
jgi:hypothetical protein